MAVLRLETKAFISYHLRIHCVYLGLFLVVWCNILGCYHFMSSKVCYSCSMGTPQTTLGVLSKPMLVTTFVIHGLL